MRITHTWAVLAGLLLWGLASGVPAFASGSEAPVGHVSRIQGEALVTHAAGGGAETLRAGAPVYPHDRIETHSGSKVQLRFDDDTVVTLGPGSTLRVTRFVYNPDQGRRAAVLEMLEGALRAVVSKVLPVSSFEVHTRQAVAAVRGTRWMEEVTPTSTAVVTLEGVVGVLRVVSGAATELFLAPGEGVDVKPGAPFRMKVWGRKRVDKLRERTSFGH